MKIIGRTHVSALAVALVLAALAQPAAAQLAGRAAEEWIKTLEAPARIAGLKAAEVIGAIGLKPGDVVADLGAGAGAFALPFAKAVAPSGKVYAVEIDEGFLAHIGRKAREMQLTNVVPVTGKFTDPSIPARDVDVAFMHDVLHHVENRAEYLKNAARYLEPGGRFVIIDFDAAQSPHRDQPALVVSKEQVTQWMADAGFGAPQEKQVFADKYFLVFTKR